MQRFAADLHAFERLLRSTYAGGGRLAASAAEAHAERNLGGLAGHQILGAISDANVWVVEAMARMAEGHRMVERLARGLGIDPSAYGDVQKPPQLAPFTTGSADDKPLA